VEPRAAGSAQRGEVTLPAIALRGNTQAGKAHDASMQRFLYARQQLRVSDSRQADLTRIDLDYRGDLEAASLLGDIAHVYVLASNRLASLDAKAKIFAALS
jgi:hypothetical protein